MVGGGGGGGHERSRKSIDYLLIFVSEWTSGEWCAHLSLSLSLSLTW